MRELLHLVLDCIELFTVVYLDYCNIFFDDRHILSTCQNSYGPIFRLTIVMNKGAKHIFQGVMFNLRVQKLPEKLVSGVPSQQQAVWPVSEYVACCFHLLGDSLPQSRHIQVQFTLETTFSIDVNVVIYVCQATCWRLECLGQCIFFKWIEHDGYFFPV